MRRLITIPMSHYCERARWALDLARVEYREEQHLPGFHAKHSRRAGGTRQVPVFIDGQHVYSDSAKIVRYAHERGANLYPADTEMRARVEQLERRFAEDLGIESRRWIYFHIVPDRTLLLDRGSGQAPNWERTALRLTYPLVARLAKRGFQLSPDRVAQAQQIVVREFDFAGELLADGREYLCGDEFTAADLCFAALSAAVLVPDEYGFPLPTLDELPNEMRDTVSMFRAHPAGQSALRVYKSRPTSPLRSARPQT